MTSRDETLGPHPTAVSIVQTMFWEDDPAHAQEAVRAESVSLFCGYLDGGRASTN